MVRRIVSGMSITPLLIAMLILAYTFQTTVETVKAYDTVLKMNPSYATIGQEGEPIPTTQPVTISIEVENVTDLASWQVVLYYNDTLLYTQEDWMWLPPDHIFNYTTDYIAPPAVTGSDAYGYYIMKTVSLYRGETTFNGNGTICKINFTAVGTPGISHLNFSQPIGNIPSIFGTYLSDPDVNDIPATAVEGIVEVKGITATKEPSVITISVDKSMVYLSENATIAGNVTLEDGTPKTNVDVTINNRISGETDFNLLQTVKTDGEGRYNYTWTPTRYDIVPLSNRSCVHELQAKWLGDETTSGNQSEIISLTVEKMQIYIGADGSVKPSGVPISNVNNVTYTLTGNINGSIVVEKSNVTIDGKGYTLQGFETEDGFYLYEINNVTIRNTIIRNFQCGMHLSSSSKNTIYRNNITSNFFGIGLGGSSDNTVSGNNIVANYWDGTRLEYSSNNTLTGNNITANTCGINITANSLNNIIYHNNFVNNANQVYTENSTNLWDNGYSSGGNYWSNYTVVDVKSGPYQNETGSDGIGDTAHVIDGNNRDSYPLVTSINIFDAGTWNGVTYNVDVVSNSTVSDFYFNPDEGAFIRFNVAELGGTVGFCRVTIPKRLLWVENGEQWIVLVGGESNIPLIIEDEDFTCLYFTYTHSTKTVQIKGTHVIPEFPSAMFLLPLMVLTMLTVLFAKRKIPKNPKT